MSFRYMCIDLFKFQPNPDTFQFQTKKKTLPKFIELQQNMEIGQEKFKNYT